MDERKNQSFNLKAVDKDSFFNVALFKAINNFIKLKDTAYPLVDRAVSSLSNIG
ncbi:hypothetical protein PIPA1_23260 [Pelosinus sp. IPA-1]|nr:hypothetical protein PIPA1_23260 [Pelosinus sp. IPA-1]